MAKYEVLINATGSFKAESAYAVLIGILFQVFVQLQRLCAKDLARPEPLLSSASALLRNRRFGFSSFADATAEQQLAVELLRCVDAVLVIQ
ncbi:MAG: hypothetical protein D6697_10535 [Armatimonadetes bacterium]|jgi:hypothetical protein|nr:MAG: hypothetical protein D6697_10535 [Armatimonadota bacterium]